MAPYQYDAYRSPYAQSIAEMLLHSNDPRAQALMTGGNAQAQAAQQSGQAWAGAAQNIGNTVSAAIQHATDPRVKIEQAQLASLDRQKAGSVALGQAIKQFTKVDPKTGTPTTDHQSVAAAVSSAGFPEQAESWLKTAASNAESLDKLSESLLGHKRLEMSTYGDLAFRANSAQDFASSLGLLASKGLIDEQTAHQTVDQALAAGPDGWLQFKQKLLPFSPEFKKQQDELSKPVVLPEGAKLIAGGQVIASGTEKPPTEPELALKAAGGDPLAAMNILKPKPEQSIEKEWLARDRRLAVAKNGGQPLTDEQSRAVDATSLQQFKETNADPEIRAAALAQKAIAASLANMQLGMVPTKEQAASVAEDLVNHRIAPEQLVSLFSTRGKEGLAFKLAVTAEAKRLDPTFNFEEASASYTLAKSQNFQNTVRYMDAALESIPRLEKTAAALGNGSFRTLNQLANAGKNQFNSQDLKRFKTDALLVGDEVAKILSGGGTGSATSDAKLKQATEIFGTSDSVPALAAAADEVNFLIGNRRRALTRGTYMEGTSAVKPSAVVGDEWVRDAKGNLVKKVVK